MIAWFSASSPHPAPLVGVGFAQAMCAEGDAVYGWECGCHLPEDGHGHTNRPDRKEVTPTDGQEHRSDAAVSGHTH